jgi:hypothetical protein
MLDRATIERLAAAPELNAPPLNVALAEEGSAGVLLALARAPSLGAEALAVIAARVAHEGAAVGRDPEARPSSEAATELDRLLLAHESAPDGVRDAVLARHAAEAPFVLAASSHPRATAEALTRAVDWPAASAAHDRPWLARLGPVPEPLIAAWSTDPSALRREVAARFATDAALLAALARDPARRVRRAVAGNPHAGGLRAFLSQDPAAEVRARAAAVVTAAPSSMVALAAMGTGGTLAPDVVAALAEAPDLDAEGARLAGQVLPGAPLERLVARVAAEGGSPRGAGLATGVALRPADATPVALVQALVRALARADGGEPRLTGRARLAAWLAAGLAGAAVDGALLRDLGGGALAAERMVLVRAAAVRPALAAELGRAAAVRPALAAELCRAAAGVPEVPGGLLELAWNDDAVPDALVIDLAGRLARPRAEDRPDDEVDLDPARRSLAVLDRVVMAAAPRVDLSLRAALAVVALDARRVRYVLTALPSWRGPLRGAPLTRVLRQHAGALRAAAAEARPRGARVESWTERRLSERELGVALGLGHLTAAEVARRIAAGRQPLGDGTALAEAIEVRAALEGDAAAAPILAWAAARRTEEAAAFGIWWVLERFDRVRAASLVAGAVDAAAAIEGATPEALAAGPALLERRQPGSLERVEAHTARGRAVVMGGIARAYRAVGGLPHRMGGQ